MVVQNFPIVVDCRMAWSPDPDMGYRAAQSCWDLVSDDELTSMMSCPSDKIYEETRVSEVGKERKGSERAGMDRY